MNPWVPSFLFIYLFISQGVTNEYAWSCWNGALEGSNVCLSSLSLSVIMLIFFTLLGDLIDDSTSIKVIKGLNETIDVVLEYLRDAKVMTVILMYWKLCFVLFFFLFWRLILTGTWTKERRWSSCFSASYWEVCLLLDCGKIEEIKQHSMFFMLK